MNHQHEHNFNNEMSTSAVIWENDIIECNHMCWCRTPDTSSIRSVGAIEFVTECINVSFPILSIFNPNPSWQPPSSIAEFLFLVPIPFLPSVLYLYWTNNRHLVSSSVCMLYCISWMLFGWINMILCML